MAKFEIVQNHPKWDQFVEKLECPSPFATSSFLKLVDTCYDGQSFTLSVVSSGNIFMGAALRKVGRHIRPAPPMTYMPLIYDKLSHRTLLDAQIALGEYLKKNFSVIHYISATRVWSLVSFRCFSGDSTNVQCRHGLRWYFKTPFSNAGL